MVENKTLKTQPVRTEVYVCMPSVERRENKVKCAYSPNIKEGKRRPPVLRGEELFNLPAVIL